MLLSLSLCWYSVLEGLGCNVLPELEALLKTHMCLVQESSRRTVAACLISAGFFCFSSFSFLFCPGINAACSSHVRSTLLGH